METYEFIDIRKGESPELTKYRKMIIKDPENVYKMDSVPRGHCLIINNEIFEHLNPRRGSSRDMEELHRMFDFLGFEVAKYQDQTAKEMTNLLKELSSSPTLSQISALAVVILSHGGPNDSIYGRDGAVAERRPVDGTFITRQDLQHIFNVRKCPSMIGKPKLFILQACRGDEEDDRERSENVTANEDQHGSNYSRDDGTSLDDAYGPDTVSDHPLQERQHRAETADMCFLHSSSLGYRAYRSPNRGSPFVQDFTERIMQHAYEKSLQRIIMELMNEFSTKQIGSTKMTMPENSNSLTRKWYFNPPNEES